MRSTFTTLIKQRLSAHSVRWANTKQYAMNWIGQWEERHSNRSLFAPMANSCRLRVYDSGLCLDALREKSLDWLIEISRRMLHVVIGMHSTGDWSIGLRILSPTIKGINDIIELYRELLTFPAVSTLIFYPGAGGIPVFHSTPRTLYRSTWYVGAAKSLWPYLELGG